MAEKTIITDKPIKVEKTKKKRLPKGQRIHARRVKQEANKPGAIHT